MQEDTENREFNHNVAFSRGIDVDGAQPKWPNSLDQRCTALPDAIQSCHLAAVNRTMRTPVEGPSIGVLLCESRSGPMVEFALENINQPIGVSTYRVTRELPAPIQNELPTVEDLREVVNKLRTEIETLRREPSDEE